MTIGSMLPSPRHIVGGMALAGLAALTATCASGGGSPPRSGAETKALFADLTGVWVVDTSSSKAPDFEIPPQSSGSPVPVDDVELGRQEAARAAEERAQGWMAIVEPVYTVFQAPTTVILRVDEERLVFEPTPGHRVEVPMSGEWIEETPGGHPVRTRVYWDGDRLALEHRPRSGGQVRSVLEVVEGRLRITTRIRVLRRSAPPVVMVYDRDEEGEVGAGVCGP